MEKFNFTPFQQVLVRDSVDDVWATELFSHYDQDGSPRTSGNNAWNEVIPFEGNENLRGTWDDYVEPYVPKDGERKAQRNHPMYHADARYLQKG